jgi:Ca2+-binding RTX toxin-like protein
MVARSVRSVVLTVVVASSLAVPQVARAATIRDLKTQPAEFVAYGSNRCDRLGLSIAIGDLNGDGRDDVASGAPLDEKPGDSQFNRGALHVYFGAASFAGSRDASQPGSPDLVVYGELGRSTEDCGNKQADVLGKGVAIGDVNGDGRNDLAVSAVRADGPGDRTAAGKVYIFYGASSWPSVIDLSVDPSQADVTVIGDLPSGDFGIHLAIGDFDADGFGDVLVGAASILNTTRPGGLRVIYGDDALPSTIDMASPPADVRTFFVNGQLSGDKLGHGVATGDLNGDGIADIVGGAPRGEGPCGETSGSGKAHVFFGSASAPPTGTWNLATNPAPFTVVSGEAGDQMARRLAVADVTGDGDDDLILGARCGDGPSGTRQDAGAGYVLFGPIGTGTRNLSTAPANVTVFGAHAEDFLGVGPASSDVNDDGNADLVLGADEADGPDGTRTSAGEAVVLLGPLQSTTRDLAVAPADLTIHGPDANDRFGRFIGSGDLNGDGRDDLAITAYFGAGPTNASSEVGEFHVLTGLALSPVTITAIDAAASEGGSDTARFSVNRSGTSGSLLVGYQISGTAVNGSDYVALSGSVTIPSGSASATIDVVPIQDAIAEGPESVVLTLQPGSNYSVGSPGSATATIADDDGTCTITGTPGPDVLSGTSGADVICGLGGDDSISAGAGNDVVFGGDGNDTIKGGAGDDAIFGEAGADGLKSQSGADTVSGGDGDDKLNDLDGIGGNDSLDGGGGTDTCRADPGDTVTNCP